MTFHYIRKNDATGTIQRVNGMGVGLALRKLEVNRSRLPLASQVEIIRFAADILNDAMKNKFVHGDIKIDNFAVMNDGSLIINGYDRPRRNSITPEGTMSLAGDIYGLGLVMLELFSGQRNIELPLEQHLHNQTVLQIFLTIDWQEWAQQPWLTTMQEYLISLLFFEPSQRPHPLDIANILKEASQITTSLGIRDHMERHGLKVSMENESLEMAQALRSSALISPVEVMADSEGTATGFFTRDKIAEMFNQPIAEDTVRRTEWTPESTTPVKTVDPRPLTTPSVDAYDDNVSLDLPPGPAPNSPQPEPTPPVQQSTWTPNQFHNPTPPPVAPAWTPPEKTVQPPPQPTWTPRPAAMPRVEEQPTATHPSPQPWQPSVQPVQEQPTPSIPPASSHPPNRTPTPPPIPTPPQFSIGAGQQTPPPSWANPQPHNRMVAASHHQVQQETGGIDKNILIGAGIGALLIFMMGIGAWALLSGEDSIEDDAIQVERIEPQFNDDEFEDIEPSEEEVEEVEEPIEEIKPKASPPKKTSKPKRKKKSSKKKPSQKTEQTKTQTPPEQTSVAPPIEGVGEFSVTIRFNKPATLKCGDGQSKDFVNQTKMTFKTRTACRINTEDDEQGALSASKSGTIRCSLSGTRIRCK